MLKIGIETLSNTRNVVAMTSEMKCYTVAHVREKKERSALVGNVKD